MVGDEDQSIYGFRAAYPEALLQFRTTYPDAHVLKLERNYRSTPEIVTVANDFIRQNRNRYQKKMFTERPSVNKVKFLKLNKREDQYHAIVHTLLPRFEGKTAVIYRNNESAIPLAVEMMKAGRQFVCNGMDNVFFKSRVVSDICKIMQSALDPFNYSLMWETYSLFNAHVSRKAVYNATKTADQRRYDSLWYALYFGDDVSRNYKPAVKNIAQEMAAIRSNNNAKDAIARICSMGYKRADDDKVFILRTLAENGESIESFISRLGTLELSVPSGSSGRGGQGIQSAPGRQGNISAQASQVAQGTSSILGTQGAPYIFTTVHSSKGLEYDNVIIMDEIDPIFPDKRMDIEEERRLFYVAVTRAKNNLVLLSYGNQKQPFIDDIQRSVLAGNRTHGSGQVKDGSGRDKTGGSAPETGTTRRPSGTPVTPKYGDNEKGAPTGTPIVDKSYFSIGIAVAHKMYGAGRVTDVRGDIVTIEYSGGVIKKHSINISCEKGLFYMQA
jgi:DNA helicase-2/ATP-dependent DNA helicase PcrA